MKKIILNSAEMVKDLSNWVLDGLLKTPPPSSVLAMFAQDGVTKKAFVNSLATIQGAGENITSHNKEINFLMLSLTNILLAGIAAPSIAQDLDEVAINNAKIAISSLIKSLDFCAAHKSFRKILKKHFEEDLAKTDIIDGINNWKSATLDERKKTIVNIVHHMYRSAQSVQEGFDDLPTFVEFTNFQGNVLGTCCSTGILIKTDLITDDAPEKAVLVACHEASHMLEKGIQDSQNPEFQEDQRVFDYMRYYKGQYPDFYKEFIYFCEPRERLNDEKYFCDIIMSKTNPKPLSLRQKIEQRITNPTFQM